MTDMMKTSFRERLLRGERVFGSHISVTDPSVTEIMAHSDLDFVWIDTEHTPLGLKCVEDHIARIRQTDAAVVVRARMNDRNHVKRILEMGVDGIVFPQIKTPEEARAAVTSCLYPPEGTRGFGPRGAIHFGLLDAGEYLATANQRLAKIIQLETPESIECLPELLAIKEIDVFLFGPCDLSIQYGEPLRYMEGKTREAMQYATALIRKAGRCVGISMGRNDDEFLQYCVDLGINMISTGSDFDYILWAAQDYHRRIQRFRGKVQS